MGIYCLSPGYEMNTLMYSSILLLRRDDIMCVEVMAIDLLISFHPFL